MVVKSECDDGIGPPHGHVMGCMGRCGKGGGRVKGGECTIGEWTRVRNIGGWLYLVKPSDGQGRVWTGPHWRNTGNTESKLRTAAKRKGHERLSLEKTVESASGVRYKGTASDPKQSRKSKKRRRRELKKKKTDPYEKKKERRRKGRSQKHTQPCDSLTKGKPCEPAT